MSKPAHDPSIDTSKYVSASRVAALYGTHPWITEWMLYQRHAAGVDLGAPEEGKGRLYWGRRLEPIILEEVADELALEVRAHPQARYIVDPAGAPLGCRTDAHVLCPTRGRGVVSAKCADWLVWADAWGKGDTIPKHVALQLQAEMACHDVRWGVFGVLVGGNDLHVIEQQRVDAVVDDLRERAADFMLRVIAGREPDPTGSPRELPVLEQLWPTVQPGSFRDLRGAPSNDVGAFDAAAEAFLSAADAKREAGAAYDAARVQIIKLHEDDETLLSDLFRSKVMKGGRGIRVTVKYA